MFKVGKLASHVAAAYLVAWHLSFLIFFGARGDDIDCALYAYYVRFIVVPGFELPSFIQVSGVVLTGVYFVMRMALFRPASDRVS